MELKDDGQCSRLWTSLRAGTQVTLEMPGEWGTHSPTLQDKSTGALGRQPQARGQEDMPSGQGWHIAQEFEAQNRKSLLSFIFFLNSGLSFF